MIVLMILHAIHVSHGPHGIVAWIQPPYIAAGVGIVRDHVIAWWEVRL